MRRRPRPSRRMLPFARARSMSPFCFSRSNGVAFLEYRRGMAQFVEVAVCHRGLHSDRLQDLEGYQGLDLQMHQLNTYSWQHHPGGRPKQKCRSRPRAPGQLLAWRSHVRKHAAIALRSAPASAATPSNGRGIGQAAMGDFSHQVVGRALVPRAGRDWRSMDQPGRASAFLFFRHQVFSGLAQTLRQMFRACRDPAGPLGY